MSAAVAASSRRVSLNQRITRRRTRSATAGSDWLGGVAGLDTLTGGTGNDTLEGGDDSDMLDGHESSGRLEGGGGIDQEMDAQDRFADGDADADGYDDESGDPGSSDYDAPSVSYEGGLAESYLAVGNDTFTNLTVMPVRSRR